MPPLWQIHKENQLQCAEDYMKSDFSILHSTFETRAALGGPDGWGKGYNNIIIFIETRLQDTIGKRIKCGWRRQQVG